MPGDLSICIFKIDEHVKRGNYVVRKEFFQRAPKTSQMFQWWGRQYLNCQAAHSSVSRVFDTSRVFVSYNAHCFRCGVLTQEVKCLLTQTYMVESALHKVYAGWAIIKTNEPATAAACKSEHCFLLTIQMSSAIHHLPASGFSFASILPLQNQPFLLPFQCSDAFIPAKMQISSHLYSFN